MAPSPAAARRPPGGRAQHATNSELAGSSVPPAASIADRIVVAGVFGCPEPDYNAEFDVWAWRGLVSRTRCMAAPFGTAEARGKAFPVAAAVPKGRIQCELPQRHPLFRWMNEEHHPTNSGPGEMDADGRVVLALLAPRYVTRTSPFTWTPGETDAEGSLVPKDGGKRSADRRRGPAGWHCPILANHARVP